jgi:hypothetical protein
MWVGAQERRGRAYWSADRVGTFRHRGRVESATDSGAAVDYPASRRVLRTARALLRLYVVGWESDAV